MAIIGNKTSQISKREYVSFIDIMLWLAILAFISGNVETRIQYMLPWQPLLWFRWRTLHGLENLQIEAVFTVLNTENHGLSCHFISTKALGMFLWTNDSYQNSCLKITYPNYVTLHTKIQVLKKFFFFVCLNWVDVSHDDSNNSLSVVEWILFKLF